MRVNSMPKSRHAFRVDTLLDGKPVSEEEKLETGDGPAGSGGVG